MKFNDVLNEYIKQINCTAKELAEASGLSAATLSRYRTGERVPNDEQLNKIMDGIVSLAQDRDISCVNAEAVQASFERFLEDTAFDYEKLIANLNAMISTLDIHISELSRSLNFDPSYLSRIRLGHRRPADREKFIAGVCRYVVRKKSHEAIAELIGCRAEDISSESACFSALCKWLDSGTVQTRDYMGEFLEKLDEFDLNAYIRAIHFDELKVPSMPFQLPTSKTYYGIEAMKQGELDFFKSTVLSKSMEPVFMCSDMPMEDMGENVDFGKKWMFAIAMALKKGLHLNIIHNIDRPFKEMMLGLESWIPLYMTGQVSPYYLKGKHNSVYCHFHYVSGQAALVGECIQGYHNEGKYYLTKNKEEVAYYTKKAARLLEKAQPLMEIFRQDSENKYHAFLSADAQVEGTRHNILSSLPIYTLPQDILMTILKRHGVYNTDGEELLAFAKKQCELTQSILQHSPLFDDVPLLSREEFEKHPMGLSLSGAFYKKELYYT
ncbi:MAG: helix-turn-helix domain-containing protein, partial [Acutalibacteraceae bacterium]